jgi:hypothetical protein
VLVTSLSKYDGVKVRHLTAREFHQVAGRAGRAGYDTAGTVVVQAPDHDVENERLRRKAGDDEKKLRRIVKKKAPDGFVSWGEPTFDRLVAAAPEPLTSSFRVSHAMLLNVIAREGDAFEAMRRLLRENHEDSRRQVRLVRRAIAIYRSLLTAGVVERLDPPDSSGRVVRLVEDLQLDFALNQALSPFALACLELLDREAPDYPLDVVSVIEATLEDPRPVIAAQQFKARGEAVAQLKAEGVEYEERMELLEEVTHPRPLAEMLDAAYKMYRRGHPWVGDHELSPKSVVREMYEQAQTFAEYVRYYRLARSEGLVLRYLADAYRALRSGVPEEARTEELSDVVEWLGEMVRQVDSSLLEEWEQLTSPDAGRPGDAVGGPVAAEPDRPRPVTVNDRAFKVLVRNAMFRRVELAARRDWEALGELDGESGWDADAWREALAPYFAAHDEIDTGPDARGPHLLLVEAEGRVWRVAQVLDDPAGDHDWRIEAVVDLDASDDVGTAVVAVSDVRML